MVEHNYYISSEDSYEAQREAELLRGEIDFV